jgi:hypothetical protein
MMSTITGDQYAKLAAEQEALREQEERDDRDPRVAVDEIWHWIRLADRVGALRKELQADIEEPFGLRAQAMAALSVAEIAMLRSAAQHGICFCDTQITDALEARFERKTA